MADNQPIFWVDSTKKSGLIRGFQILGLFIVGSRFQQYFLRSITDKKNPFRRNNVIFFLGLCLGYFNSKGLSHSTNYKIAEHIKTKNNNPNPQSLLRFGFLSINQRFNPVSDQDCLTQQLHQKQYNTLSFGASCVSTRFCWFSNFETDSTSCTDL